MEDAYLGRRFRALRHRLGWRQEDLARRSGVSRGLVSLIERGRIEEVGIRQLRRVAHELDAQFAAQLRWRGGDLDRLLDEGHARLVGQVAELLRKSRWDLRIEVSYSVYGERGSIDLLAWHAASRTILVVEVKTELVSVEETLRKHDEKTRLARRVAAGQLGWTGATAVGRLLVLPDLSTPRRRVVRHEAVLVNAYPERGASVRAWLTEPRGPVSGVLFVGLAAGQHASIARKRIRHAIAA